MAAPRYRYLIRPHTEVRAIPGDEQVLEYGDPEVEVVYFPRGGRARLPEVVADVLDLVRHYEGHRQ